MTIETIRRVAPNHTIATDLIERLHNLREEAVAIATHLHIIGYHDIMHEIVDAVEEGATAAVLACEHGNQSQTAIRLGWNRLTVAKRLKEWKAREVSHG